jgi:hypothetical protein
LYFIIIVNKFPQLAQPIQGLIHLLLADNRDLGAISKAFQLIAGKRLKRS